VTRHMRTCASMVSLGVPSSLVTMKSAPPVEVMPWATMNRAAHTHTTHTRGYGVNNIMGMGNSSKGASKPAGLQAQCSSGSGGSWAAPAGRPAFGRQLTDDGHEARVAKAHQGVLDGQDLENDLQKGKGDESLNGDRKPGRPNGGTAPQRTATAKRVAAGARQPATYHQRQHHAPDQVSCSSGEARERGCS
jgi:hypothetical protein